MHRKALRVTLVCVILVLSMSGFAHAQSFKFASLGDSRGSDNGINEVILTELVPALIAEQVELVLFSGDLINSGTEAELRHWVEVFMDPLRAAGIPVYPCRGNHDGNRAVWDAVFSGDYAFPANGPAGETNVTYAVTYKNALFLMMEMTSFTLNYAWLAEQIEANPLPHVFVTNHYPAFAVDHGGILANFPELRDGMWNTLYEAGCPTFFVGHDHFYDHSRIQDAAGNWVHQYVVGTAGAPLYDWNGTYADSRVQAISHYKNNGYVLGEVDGADVTLTFKQRTAPGVYEETDDVYNYRTAKALPIARFSATETSGKVPLQVFFADESLQGAGAISGWLWDFGDGTTSTEQNPEHLYTDYGTYTVTLTVSNEYGSDTVSQANLVTAGLPAATVPSMIVLACLLVLSTFDRYRRQSCAAERNRA